MPQDEQPVLAENETVVHHARLMDVGGRLHEGQIRLAYYLMTVNASVAALTFSRLEASPVNGAAILLASSIACWVTAFFFGVLHLAAKNGLLALNVASMKVEEGSHELIPDRNPELEKAALARMRQKFGEVNKKATTYIRWQMTLMVAGLVFLALWLLALKLCPA